MDFNGTEQYNSVVGLAEHQRSNLRSSSARDTTIAASNQSPERSRFNTQLNQDTVTLSPQAQIVQQSGREAQSTGDELERNNQAEQVSQSVRVSSTVGKTASKFGLTEQEAIDLYEKIDSLV